MSQKRILNYGDPVVAEHITTLIQNITDPVVLSGGEFSVTVTGKLRIAPITLALPDGILLIEDQYQEMEIPSQPNAFAWTIVYTHENQETIGGNAAVLEKRSGLISQANLPKSTVIGYINHPGGSDPLNPTHFIKVKKATITPPYQSKGEQDSILAPFVSDMIEIFQDGGNIDVSSHYESATNLFYTKFRNNSANIGQREIGFPFVAHEYPPSRIFVRTDVEFGAGLTVSIHEAQSLFEYEPTSGVWLLDVGADPVDPSDDVLQFVSSNLINNTNGFVLAEFAVPNFEDRFLPGSVFFVKLNMIVNSGKELKIMQVGVSPYNLP